MTIASGSHQLGPDSGSLVVKTYREGVASKAGRTRPVSPQLDVDPEGRVTGTIPVTQSDWGIKPYRGLMGALKVRDEVEIVIEASLGRQDRPDQTSHD